MRDLERPHRHTPGTAFVDRDRPRDSLCLSGRDFAALLHAALGFQDGICAVIQAYFDESERDEGGLFAVAGYAFRPERAVLAHIELDQLLSGRVFHAKDIAAGRGGYEGIHNAEKGRLFRGAVEIILRTAAVGAVASCEPIDARWSELDGARRPFGLCYQFVLTILSEWAQAEGEDIAYFLQAGHKDQPEVERIMRYVSTGADGLKERYRYVSHTFVDSARSPLCGTADLLAWEWTKSRSDHERPTRKSLQALLQSEAVRHFNIHLDKARLEAHQHALLDLMKEANPERAAEIEAAFWRKMP